MKRKVLLDRYPYRYVEVGELANGKPDCRLERYDSSTKRYKEIYLFDNQMQMMTAMSDIDYCKWLDPEGGPCYIKDRLINHYESKPTCPEYFTENSN